MFSLSFIEVGVSIMLPGVSGSVRNSIPITLFRETANPASGLLDRLGQLASPVTASITAALLAEDMLISKGDPSRTYCVMGVSYVLTTNCGLTNS
jgi:hypothetical protein